MVYHPVCRNIFLETGGLIRVQISQALDNMEDKEGESGGRQADDISSMMPQKIISQTPKINIAARTP